MEALIGMTREAARDGRYEVFKTSAFFDQTAKFADWPGADSEAVKAREPG